MSDERLIIPLEEIAPTIVSVRGQRVILDSDLARLYGVETRTLNQAVPPVIPDRFPGDFLMELSVDEFRNLKSQSVISSEWGGRREAPCTLLPNTALSWRTRVLSTPRAVEVSVYVVRAFVRLRSIFAAANGELGHRLDELEVRIDSHDDEIALLVEAIRQLALPPESSDRRIGLP